MRQDEASRVFYILNKSGAKNVINEALGQHAVKCIFHSPQAL